MSPVQQHIAATAPAELSGLRGWLVWKFETFLGENKPRKIPYYVSGGKRFGHQGSDRDRESLTDFHTARKRAVEFGFDGVGFAPLADFNITALDFDKCVDANGSMPEEVRAIVSRTYAEYSPSGTGVRAFLRGNLGNHKSTAKNNPFGFETFASSGFVTLTGAALPSTELLGLEDTISDVDADVETLCRQRFGADRQAAGVDGDDPWAGLERPMGLTIDEMQALLAKLDPNMGREDWIRVGMALHFETEGDDTGFTLFDEWSSHGDTYPTTDGLKAQWESFDRPRPAGRRPTTMATVMWLVKQAALEGVGQRAASAEDLKASAAETPAGDPKGAMSSSEGFKGKYRLVSAGALSRRPPGSWLIKQVIPKADVVVLFGASGSGKSFVAMDMAAAIARGVPWRDCRTVRGRVAIIAAEGGGGVGKRLKAYAQHHRLDIDQLDIGVLTAAPNFLQKEEISEVVAMVRDVGGADLIIADTFAQVTPGANENAGEDMGLALANAKALGEATGALVMLIHHSGKDTTKGARGWSGIKAAADAQIEVIKHETGGREIRIDKMKDGDDGLQWGFKLEIVTVGRDADGDDITSCVAIDAAVPLPPADDAPRSGAKRYSRYETHVLEMLEMEDKTRSSVSLEGFITRCSEALPEPGENERDTRRQNIKRAVDKLVGCFEARAAVLYGPKA